MIFHELYNVVFLDDLDLIVNISKLHVSRSIFLNSKNVGAVLDFQFLVIVFLAIDSIDQTKGYLFSFTQSGTGVLNKTSDLDIKKLSVKIVCNQLLISSQTFLKYEQL